MRRRRRATLSAQDREKSRFLFEPLATVLEDECPDLDTLLQRLKANGVPLDTLSELLLRQLVIDDARVKRVPAIRQACEDFDDGSKDFEQAHRKLKKASFMLDAPMLGVRPPATLELLDACASILGEVRATFYRVLMARWGKAATGAPRRERELKGLGISRDDARELYKVVKLAAHHVGLSGVSWQYGMQRCPACNNPAPALFGAGAKAAPVKRG